MVEPALYSWYELSATLWGKSRMDILSSDKKSKITIFQDPLKCELVTLTIGDKP